MMPPGGTLVVRNIAGDINAYAPVHGAPANQYTIEAFGSGTSEVRSSGSAITVRARSPGIRYLIRGARDTLLDLQTDRGSIAVEDFDGVANVRTGSGDIRMLIPRYGQTAAGNGNVNVIFGSAGWPGTLRFTTAHGDVDVYVNATAAARLHLHTGRGTIYTDFPLRGRSHGQSETIDGAINGGAQRGVDVEVRNGSIRVLQLKPQI